MPTGQPFADAVANAQASTPNDRIEAFNAIAAASELPADVANPPTPAFASSGQVGNRFQQLTAQMEPFFPQQAPLSGMQQIGLFLLAVNNPEGAQSILNSRAKERLLRDQQKSDMQFKLLNLAQSQVQFENEDAFNQHRIASDLARLRMQAARLDGERNMDSARMSQLQASARLDSARADALTQANALAFGSGTPNTTPDGFRVGSIVQTPSGARVTIEPDTSFQDLMERMMDAESRIGVQSDPADIAQRARDFLELSRQGQADFNQAATPGGPQPSFRDAATLPSARSSGPISEEDAVDLIERARAQGASPSTLRGLVENLRQRIRPTSSTPTTAVTGVRG